jgi:protein tyrosine phosphatase (PTP) superfamily phosphohydrolase (DUF442 family)
MPLPNFHKVSDDLYRGAQPDREGFVELIGMGVKTVINLRWLHTDRIYLYGLLKDVNYRHIFCKAWHPEVEDVKSFLRILDEGPRPVFVHCQHGADRTGVMCAAYRIKVQGWEVDRAVKEMVEGPFGFHEIWEDILPPFLEQFRNK